ncbi:MAG: DUF3179 domain-containing protein [Candidatus Harrisonbacteria bacterium]|nr:DUF3179 domain-containing protein [Candidatus Harrisonbacteria bacterium]
MSNQRKIIIAVVIVSIFVIFGLSRTIFKNDFSLPKGGETQKETITIQNNDGAVPSSAQATAGREKEIMVTNGVKHSVPLDSILGGGPPKDGIPSIDHPKFIPIGEASKQLSDAEPGLALEIGNVNRFYPFQILVWHEIVNDTINGRRVSTIPSTASECSLPIVRSVCRELFLIRLLTENEWNLALRANYGIQTWSCMTAKPIHCGRRFWAKRL